MRIFLKTGEAAVIDAEDSDLVSKYCWYLHKKGYACAFEGRRIVYMHRLVLGISDKCKIDHKDGIRLNNQKHNLRPATGKQNQGNRKINSTPKSSRFKGVSWLACRNRWRATLGFRQDGKRTTRYLGLYADEVEAAKAYNAAALAYFGVEFALLNPV